jgi:hypothetical protein
MRYGTADVTRVSPSVFREPIEPELTGYLIARGSVEGSGSRISQNSDDKWEKLAKTRRNQSGFVSQQ